MAFFFAVSVSRVVMRVLVGLLAISQLSAQAQEMPVMAPALAASVDAAQDAPPLDTTALTDALRGVENPRPVLAAPTTAPVVDCISVDAEGRFMGWVDSQHCRLSNRTTMTAQWFDGLFGHHYEPTQAKIRLRLVNDFNWFEGQGLSAKTRFRASAVLPNAKKRLRLVVSDDEDTLHPERNQLGPPEDTPKTSAAIRWIPDTLSRVKYSFDIGLHSTPDIYARIRAQRLWRLSDSSIVTFIETMRYGVKEEAKSISQLEIERLLNRKTVFRLGNAIQYWQKEPEPVGLRWTQDWSILHRLGQQKTISYGVIFEGVQQPSWQLGSDSVFVLYRQSFWRPWLYYEVEPHLTRYREQNWDVVSSIIFRLEANFGG